MKAIAVTMKEAGNWIDFPCRPMNTPEGIRVHAIKFDNGLVWDAYNGFRGNPEIVTSKPRYRVKMRRAIV